jgi:outer membrane protein assembly factor BamB
MNSGRELLLLVLAFGVLSFVAAAQPVKGGDWTSLTLNSNDTRYQMNSTVNATNVNQLVPAWNLTTQNSVTSTPLVQDGNVYFADWGGYVYSANIVNGSINWKDNLGAGISSTPLVYNGVVYIALGPSGTADVGASIGNLKGENSTAVFALNQSTGNVLWINNLNRTTRMDAIWASPIVYKNLLYIGVASQGDESERAWKGAIYGIYANNGVMAWNTTGPANTIGYGSSLLAGPDGGDALTGSVVIDPLLNQIYFGTGNPYAVYQTPFSPRAKDITAANTLVLTLSGPTSWISASNPLLVTVTGNAVGKFSTFNSVSNSIVLATDSNSIESQSFLITSNAPSQTLTSTTGNFYYISQISLDSPDNPRTPDPTINGSVTEVYLGVSNTVNSIGTWSLSENSLYGYSIISLNATNGKMVWYNQVCKSGLDFCGDGDFVSSPNLFSITTSLANCSLGCNAVGLGGKDGNYIVLNRLNGNFIERVQIGTSFDYANGDGGIIGLAGMTNTTNPEIFVPSYYTANSPNFCAPTVCGIVKAFYPSNGVVAWSYDTSGVPDGSVTVIPGAVLVEDISYSTGKGQVYAISSKTGKLLWSHKLTNGGSGGVTSAEGYVLAPGFLGSNQTLGVYAFEVGKVPTLTLSNSLIDQGQSILLTANAPFGVQSYRYSYQIANAVTGAVVANMTMPITASTANSWLWTPPPTLAANGMLEANVTVSYLSVSSSSAYQTFSYSAALSPELSAAITPTIPAGLREVFTASAGGGTGPYTYNYQIFNSVTNAVLGNYLSPMTAMPTNSYTWTVPAADAGNTIFANVMITDHPNVSTNATSTRTGIVTVSNQPNQTVLQMVSALQKDGGFTNLTYLQSVATISSPGIMFFGFDKSARGANVGANVLVFALPLGYQYKNWGAGIPTTVYQYYNLANVLTNGTITFQSITPNSVFGGRSSGGGLNWINWKEIVPVGTIIANYSVPTTTTSVSTTSTSTSVSTTSVNTTTTVLTTSVTTTIPVNTTTSVSTTSTTTTVNTTTSLNTTTSVPTTSITTTIPVKTTTSVSTTSTTTSVNTTTSVPTSTIPVNTTTTSVPTTTTSSTTSVPTSTTTSKTTSVTTTATTTILTTTSIPTTVTTTSTVSTSSTTVSATTTVLQNQTVQQMITKLRNEGFTNVSLQQSTATISPPAVMFIGFDRNSYGTNKGGTVLLFAFPMGYQYKSWTSNSPYTYKYLNLSGTLTSGSINFTDVPANDFFGGGSSGNGNFINWKELTPGLKYESLVH